MAGEANQVPVVKLQNQVPLQVPADLVDNSNLPQAAWKLALLRDWLMAMAPVILAKGLVKFKLQPHVDQAPGAALRVADLKVKDAWLLMVVGQVVEPMKGPSVPQLLNAQGGAAAAAAGGGGEGGEGEGKEPENLKDKNSEQGGA